MRRPIEAASVLMAMVLVTLSAARAGPVRVAPRHSGFTVVLPPGFPAPRRSKRPLSTSGGPATWYTYSSRRGGTLCMISMTEYPAALHRGDARAELSLFRDRQLARARGRLLGESWLRLGKYWGKRMRFTCHPVGGPAGYARVEAYTVGRRFYQVQLLSPKASTLGSAEANRYFRSFRLR